jgi:hypothetical protein
VAIRKTCSTVTRHSREILQTPLPHFPVILSPEKTILIVRKE